MTGDIDVTFKIVKANDGTHASLESDTQTVSTNVICQLNSIGFVQANLSIDFYLQLETLPKQFDFSITQTPNCNLPASLDHTDTSGNIAIGDGADNYNRQVVLDAASQDDLVDSDFEVKFSDQAETMAVSLTIIDPCATPTFAASLEDSLMLVFNNSRDNQT